MNRMLVLGTEIDKISLTDAIELALDCMEYRRSDYVVTPNSEIVLRARKERELREAIHGSLLSLPDSVGVELASRILGTPLEVRIPGIDFAASLLGQMSKSRKSIFLLGAKAGVAARAARALQDRFPGIVIAGTENGFFEPSAEEKIIERINTASPDLLLVCLGSPKQELWMYRNASSLRVGLMAGLGGALDVFSGDVPRAPMRWRKFGIEWLFRLIHEPKRMTRTIKLPLILFAAAWNRIKGERKTWQRES